MIRRCFWAEEEPMKGYHDREWGTPLHEDRKLFEFLSLEAAQAGLSWLTILRRRDSYRTAFKNFDPKKVSKFNSADVKKLLGNSGIIRNRLKIIATINNAKRFIEVQNEFGSFDKYIWGFVANRPIANKIRGRSDIVATTPLSDLISKDLKKRGFAFVGSTICYAYMQAIGMVDDHMLCCFRHSKSKNAGLWDTSYQLSFNNNHIGALS